jgi:subtilisin-like proprotein convertase family protein
MNHLKIWTGLLLTGAGVIALQAQVSETNSFTGIDLVVPDGDPAGVTDVRTITSGIAHITSLQVQLNISSDFNGDLYGYLQHGNGLTVLINRAGRTASNTNGYDDCGFDVTFSDSAADDIHNYRLVTTPPPGSPLTGTWQPDARYIDPTLVTDTSLRTTFLSEFDGLSAQGNWVLFLAGMEYGGTNTLNSWALDITGTPFLLPSVTWSNPPAITYGTALGPAQLSATANVPGSFSYGPPAGTVLQAGLGQSLSVTFVPSDTNDYLTATATVTLDVLPQPLAVTANDASRTYGTTNPPLAGSIVGVTNADNITAVFTTAADASSPVGSYPIVPVLQDPNGALGNYSVTTNSATLYVTPATLAVVAQNQNQTYGAATPLLTWSAAGFANGDTQDSALTGSPILSTSATPASPVGPYPIIIAQGSLVASNYTFNLVNGVLTVTPAVLTGQANNASRPYGETNPVFTASYSGFVNGDTASVVTGALSGSSPARTNSPVGTYPISVSGQGAANYTIQYLAGILSIGPTPLLVQANNASRVVGQTNPVFTASFIGLVNEDSPTVLEGPLLFTTTADTNSPVGSYPIVPSGLSSTNYTLTYSNGTLSVCAFALVVTSDNQSRTYGATNPTLTGTLAGLQNGDNITATYSTAADASSPVGTYDIGVGLNDPGNVLSNYSVTTNTGTLTITPAPLTVSADNQGRNYGATNPPLTGAIVGLQNGDNITAAFSTAANTNSLAGAYVIAVGLSDPDNLLPNYSVTTNTGTLTITPVPLLVSADNQSRSYGATNSPLTGTFVGLQNGDNITATLSTLADAASVVGSYPITVSLSDPGGKLPSYIVTTNDGTLTVTPAPLAVTADNQSRSYGAANLPLTGTLAGLQNGDNITASFSTTAGTGSPVGNYPITFTLSDPGNLLGNYSLSTTNGVLTVTPAVLTGQANNASRLYGQTNPVFTVSYSGFVNGDDASLLSGPLIWTCLAQTNSPAGSYPISVSGQTAPNYTIQYLQGILTVGPAPLLVQANNASRVYGQTNPIFSATFVGLVNNDDARALEGPLLFTTTAETNSPVGSYPIVPSGLSLTNYSVTYSNGTLSVTAYSLVVTPDDQSRTYGATNPSLTTTLAGLQDGDNITATCSTAANTNSPVGTYNIEVAELNDPNNLLTNYTVTTNTGTLTITPAPLAVTADNQGRSYGATNPPLTGTVAGLQNGDNITASFSTTAGTGSPAGNYPITFTLSDPDNLLGNYSLSSTNGVLTVVPAVLIGQANNASRPYGQTNPVFTVSYSGFVNGDDASLLSGPLIWTCPAQTNSPAGIYPISVSGQTAPNYAIQYLPGSLTVGPAPLLVQANNASRAYGQTNPIFTATFVGLLNNDDATALQGSLLFTTTADTNSPVGSYPIVPSGLTSTNYSLTFADGALSVTAHALVVTADNQSRSYGATNPPLTGTVVGLQDGDNITATYSTDANTNSPVGIYVIAVALNDPNNLLTNYTVTTNTGTLTITPLAAIVSSTNPAFLSSPVTFTATFIFGPVGQVAGSSGGGVQFNVDGAPYGSPVALAGGQASITISSLSLGSHSLSADYDGGTNYLDATAVLNPPQFIRTPPVAPDYVIARAPGQGTKVHVADLVAASSDGEGGTLAFDTFSPASAQGGTVRLAGGWLFYEPPAGFGSTDSFTYTMLDHYGVSASGTVTILVNNQASCLLTLAQPGDGTSHILVSGIPWRFYAIQYENQLRPSNWQLLAIGTADSQGNFQSTNALPQGTPMQFYRAFWQAGATPGAVVTFLTSSANPALPGAPVTFTASIFPDDPGLGFPSGTVQFDIDGQPAGPPVALAQGVATLTTSSIPAGQHAITAVYGGDSLFLPATGALVPPQLINTPPIAAAETLYRPPTSGTKTPVSALLANDSDPDGNPITFDGISSTTPEGGTASLVDGWVLYSPPLGFAGPDSFGYTIQDSFGATATGTVTVQPLASYGPAQSAAFVALSGGTYSITFNGIPWNTYAIQYSQNPTSGPWQDLGTSMANSWGTIQFSDTPPPGAPPRYYRAVAQPQATLDSPFRIAVWNNFIANTNGRTMQMWSEYSLPDGWPSVPPVMAWDTNCLLFGLDGFTAISQCNQFQGAPGQVPATLLTPRHAYTRGHGMSDNGFGTSLAGQSVWFCTASNTIVQMTVAADFIRLGTFGGQAYDYGILVFTEDAPPSITPMSVLSEADYEIYYPDTPDLPFMFFGTTDDGNCSAQVPPFVYPLLVGGDSGSPNMIPTPDNKLAMFSGRSTSGASTQMQADIDTLTAYVGLTTNNYQLRWYDMRPWGP